jgi:phosphonate transport system substrate-binding protein
VGGSTGSIDRRKLLLRTAAAAVTGFIARPVWGAAADPIRFALTPVFLTSDLELLERLKSYLEAATARPVQLVTRRTYQEITTLLVSGQVDGAWICGYPFVAYERQLALVAVPVWRGKPLYQSYLIADSSRTEARSIEDLRGDIHAFSDPDSNSGFLVTAAELARKGVTPERFFQKTIFTYGHANVVRAVASGLAQSGSVDGYVYEVLREVEPNLTKGTRLVRASDWYAFPPIACPAAAVASEGTARLKNALLRMHEDPSGREVLGLLRLDRFEEAPPSLFGSIAANMHLVRGLG